jgi:hypothetical protein
VPTVAMVRWMKPLEVVRRRSAHNRIIEYLSCSYRRRPLASTMLSNSHGSGSATSSQEVFTTDVFLAFDASPNNTFQATLLIEVTVTMS